jgi:hypothetical protein
MIYDVQGEDTMDVVLYLYTTYFLFITWSYHQEYIFHYDKWSEYGGFIE